MTSTDLAHDNAKKKLHSQILIVCHKPDSLAVINYHKQDSLALLLGHNFYVGLVLVENDMPTYLVINSI